MLAIPIKQQDEGERVETGFVTGSLKPGLASKTAKVLEQQIAAGFVVVFETVTASGDYVARLEKVIRQPVPDAVLRAVMSVMNNQCVDTFHKDDTIQAVARRDREAGVWLARNHDRYYEVLNEAESYLPAE
jgi:hypothetical protein